MTSSADEPSPEDRVPRLSVVIPAWNAAASIERSVRSVLEERVVPLECVVVDDGSTDATWDVIERLRADDPRVVAIRLAENGGVSNARNVALEVARGEWLAFHDADDRMLPGGVAALLQATADPDVRVVVGQRIWTDGTRRWLTKPYDIPDIREPGRKSIATHPGLMYYASATGKAFHRSLADGLVFHGRLLGDQAWTIRALLRADDGIEVIGDTVFEWFRPAEDGPAEGITATSRSSARGASEIARMAEVVFGQVAAEVDATIEEQPTRSRVKHVYFGRLVRSDVSGQVVKAVERRDRDTAQLFDAVAAFVRSVPSPIVADSETALAMLLRPPPRRWLSVSRSARSAYWRMTDAVAEAGPGVLRRLPVPSFMKPAFALAATGRPAARMLAGAYLSLIGIGLAVVDRRRRS
jgi:glycosyltransferase involved in cell wall biosynthesis